MEDKKNTVLFVDDEVHILSSIRRAVADEDFHSVFANSGHEALQMFEKHEISVVVTDMRMPGMDGLTLLKAVREKHPQTVRIVLSGYTQLSQVLATVNMGDIFQFIPKPWKMEEELLVTVRQAIERFNLENERDSLRAGLEKRNQAYQKIFNDMERKFAHEKKDLTNLKRINHWMFEFWKKQLAMSAGNAGEAVENTAKYVDTIEEIQLMYLDILPTVSELKSMARMIDDITKACAERLIIRHVPRTELSLLGYHVFLGMVFKVLVYLISLESKAAIVSDMTVAEGNEGSYIITFELRQPPGPVSALNQNRLRIGCSFLSEMGRIYNTKILPELVNGELSLIRVTWQTTNATEK